ncbi:RagB/SusD family nutrient uptake outer membrane protein [Chitinophaga sp. RAB17]|uniref:RagB/SusD family nutrient uptake outer membrane protein n=1 Tax=Chitinophaga sp. RAB17 TaxID=3233049 RepID=UPI003F926AB8
MKQLIIFTRNILRKNFRLNYYSNKYNIRLYIFSFVILIYPTSCKKSISINAPITSINGKNVYQTDITAAAVMTGIYVKMTSTLHGGGLASLSLVPALSADELILYGGTSSTNKDYIPYYLNLLTRSTTGSMDFSATIYLTIYITNTAINGLINSSTLTPLVKNQLLGEAKFMRSFCYFYLVNLYGDVPLALTTDYTITSVLPRVPKKQVLQQIISDLKDAQTLLTDNYVAGNAKSLTEERVRPNKWAATALLARTYLYDESWDNAEKEATLVINNSSLYHLNTINEVFLRNSNETIWALQPTLNPTNVSNTEDAKLFVLPATGPTINTLYPFYLSQNVIASFEKGDERKTNWTDSVVVKQNNTPPKTYYFPYKYKISAPNAAVEEYTIVLRLAEQYLIRAEARAHLGNLKGGTDDLSLIRARAGLPETPLSTKEALLSAVLHERQVELFMEWGHRWFDLKRTKKINEVMSIVTPQKGGTWNPNWQLYPFRDVELGRDPNLVQNDGY